MDMVFMLLKHVETDRFTWYDGQNCPSLSSLHLFIPRKFPVSKPNRNVECLKTAHHRTAPHITAHHHTSPHITNLWA